MDASRPDGGGSHFDVLILGPFALFRDGVALDTSAWQRKVQALFRILVTSPDRRRSREELVDLLWQDTPGDAGARNLRVVLHMLRKGLGAGEPPTIVSEWGWIQLSPAHQWDIDLERFEESVAAPAENIAACEQAAGYYRGEPLAEDRYDDWAIAVRGRIQRSWRDLCIHLAHLHGEAGAQDAALRWLERVIESDPLDEDALRCLLQSLGALNRRTEALRRYQHFAHRLKEELDISPTTETLKVVAELRATPEISAPAQAQAQTAPASRPVPVIPKAMLPAAGTLVGRERELGRILWTLPPMHIVAPRLVMVAGEPGMGKSRLLQEVAVRARKTGILTLAGGCFKHEGSLRYGPIRDALADYVETQPEAVIRGQLGNLLPALDRIVPEIHFRLEGDLAGVGPGGESPDDRLVLFLAVTKALDRIAADIPLVLLLDDLQWADRETVELLHFIVRQSSQNRMLIVGAYASDGELNQPAVAAPAADMEAAGRAICLTLDLLPVEALALLIEERIRGRCTRDLIVALHAQAGGNPMAALQTLRLWQDEGRLEHAEGEWRLIGPITLLRDH